MAGVISYMPSPVPPLWVFSLKKTLLRWVSKNSETASGWTGPFLAARQQDSDVLEEQTLSKRVLRVTPPARYWLFSLTGFS